MLFSAPQTSPGAPPLTSPHPLVSPSPQKQELKQVFEKLHKYVGKSVETIVNRKDQPHVFRLHKKVCTLTARCGANVARPGGAVAACMCVVSASCAVVSSRSPCALRRPHLPTFLVPGRGSTTCVKTS